MTRRFRILALALCLGIFLPGCAAYELATRQSPKVYALTPKTTFNAPTHTLDETVVVEAPNAAAGLNSSRIALHPGPTSLNHYAAALWVDVVPVMVQNLTLESFSANGGVDAQGSDALVGRPDYILRLDIRDFQAEYGNDLENPPVINVRIQVRLLSAARRESLAFTSTQHLTTSEGTSVDEIVIAFDEALGKVLKRIVEWTVETIAEHTDTVDT